MRVFQALCCCCSVTKSCPTLWDPMDWSVPGNCPSLSPGVCSNSCPLSQWCHPTISSPVAPFSSCPQSFSASRSFPMSQLFATPWTTARQGFLSITNSRSPHKPMSIESVMPSNHIILCHPLLLLPSIFPSMRVFSKVSSLCQVTKVLEFQLQHQSFQWIFRTDFLKDGLSGSPCCPRASQESSPAPQFESISSSALSLLSGPILTSIHDYWKNHSFE